MPVPLRKRVKRAVRSLLLAATLAVVSRLPLRVALALGAGVGRLAWLVARGQRRLMLEHLALAFPDLGEAERRRIARDCLVHLGQTAMEIATTRSWADRLTAYVSLAPGAEDVVTRALARRRGIVFVAGHIGNWELVARRLAGLASPNAVIARRNADARLNRLVERIRVEGGYRTLWREDPGTGREIIKLLKAGGGLGILIDQDTRVQGVFVPFFGRPAYTPRAAADLALRFGSAVVVVTSHRRGPRRGDGHELELVELDYDARAADRESEVQRLTAAAVAVQERAIRRHPAEWVWMHRRWKTQPLPEGSEARAMPKSRGVSGA